MITGHIIRQHLNLCDSHVVADTIDYLEAKFLFKTDDWDGLDKWAHFANDSAVYDIRLTEDCIRKEDHLNLSAGMWKVYLHGNEFRDGEVVQRITTDEVVLYVTPTGVLDGEPFPTVPPSAGEQIIASAQLAEAGAKESAGRAAASESSADKSAKDAALSEKAASESRNAAEKFRDETEQIRNEVETSAENALDEIASAGRTAVSAVVNAGDDAITAVRNMKNAAVQTVESAGETQVREVAEAAAQYKSEAAASAQNAKTDINTARESAVTDIGNAGSDVIDAIEAAGQTKLNEIAAEKFGAVRYDIAQELTDVQRGQARDNTRSAGEIVETASGEVIAVDDAADTSLRGMVVYGKSVQDGTPTPDAPIDIVSVGGDGTVDVVVAGTNLLNIEGSAIKYGCTHEIDGNVLKIIKTSSTNTYPSLYIRMFPCATFAGKTVKFSGIQKSGGVLNLFVSERNETSLASNVTVISKITIGTAFEKTFTLPTEYSTEYFLFRLGANVTTDEMGTEYVFENLAVTLVDTDTYEPYTAQTLPISTPDGLCGIPVSSGGNYTDADGQMWVCDTVDFARGVRVQRVKKRVYCGGDDEKWSLASATTITFQCVANGAEKIATSGHTIHAISSAYPAIALSKLYDEETHFGLAGSASGGVLRIKDKRYTGAADGKEFASWVSEHPFEAVYALAEPIETPLTESELAAYRALHTNYPNTTIYADDNAGLAVDYKADTKAYIDKKFDALAAAVLANA